MYAKKVHRISRNVVVLILPSRWTPKMYCFG